MDIITEAIEQAGFLPLASNEENAGAFEAEGLRFGWEAKDGEAVFYTSLGILPQPPSTELCERLLEADCLGIGTGGGHIGLYGPTRTLLYSSGRGGSQAIGSVLSFNQARSPSLSIGESFS